MSEVSFNPSSIFPCVFSSELEQFLQQAKEAGVFLDIDFHYSYFIAGEVNRDTFNQHEIDFIGLLSVRLISSLHLQHTCLPLQELSTNGLFSDLPIELMQLQQAVSLPAQSDWLSILNRSDLVTNVETDANKSQFNTPWVLFNDFLYLTRYFQYECHIAQFINGTGGQRESLWFERFSSEQQEQAVSKYFPPLSESDPIDWQRQAVASSVSKRFSVITGGPGTGKTTTVVKLLATLTGLYLRQNEPSFNQFRIKLVAPTGKAAMRLAESIMQSKSSLELPESVSRLIPDNATTVHRILKPKGASGFFHDRSNKLNLDVLVVDEASMVDLALMSKLLDAVPNHAQVFVLGDKQQLSSVDAGNVLADLCQTHQGKLPSFVTELKKSWRFDGTGGIGQMANAIVQMNTVAIQGLLRQQREDLVWLDGLVNNEVSAIEKAVEHHVALLELLEEVGQQNEVELVLKAFKHLSQFQILTCVNLGTRGVEGVNRRVQQRLAVKGKLTSSALHYHGRPVMIGENAVHLGLFNGDIGLQLTDPYSNTLMTYFVEANGNLLKIMPQRLPKHETVYAMTVHKSQGSEFGHAALLLPQQHNTSQKVSREILYTALTRSKLKFTLLGTEAQILASVKNQTVRRSGLAHMLNL